eukprot:m.77772 g.77772  ORF g.77772 m.77772 type:complete len:201 (-) comp14080_c0_seq1:376-978(-)
MDEEHVRTLLAEGNVSALVDYCSHLELDEKTSPNGIASATVYLVFLSAYLIQHDLASARFLWKRIPQSVKQECPELTALWHVGQAMWKDVSAKDALTAYSWSQLMKAMIAELQEAITSEGFRKIAKIYTAVDIDTVMQMTSMSEANCIKHATSVMRWEYDTTSKFFKIPPTQGETKPSLVKTLAAKGISSLASNIVTLES